MKKKRILRNEKGFTLIEIIAVLVILGIMAAVAVPRYIALAQQADIGKVREAMALAIVNYNEAYRAHFEANEAYPETVAHLMAAGLELNLGDFTAAYVGQAGGGVQITLASTLPWFGDVPAAETTRIIPSNINA
jgi:MSHA pilin protein MshA